MKMEHFKKLSGINVNDFTEKRDNLTYLSWSKAWEEVKKVYPDATYNVKKFGDNQLPYVYDSNTGYMVFTDMTIECITHEMWLPVMDGKNKAMKAEAYEYTTKYGTKSVDAATMFDINKTIMRCLTKNIAMFGLGLYIYSGEDLPQQERKEALQPIDKIKIDTLKKEMERTGITDKSFFYSLHVKSWEEITITEFKLAMDKFAITPDRK